MIPSSSVSLRVSLFSLEKMTVKIHYLSLFVMPPAAPSLGFLGHCWERIPIALCREKGTCLVLLTIALCLWQSSLGLLQQGWG